MNITQYEFKGCRLFEAKDIIRITGLNVNEPSVVTRALKKFCPTSQTAKDWRDAGADVPEDLRDNSRILTEMQVARYLDHIPYALCPEVHDYFREVRVGYDKHSGDRYFEHLGIIFEHDSDEREAMEDLYKNEGFCKQVSEAAKVPGLLTSFSVRVNKTKYEVPVYSPEFKVAHFYITAERMTEFEGYSLFGKEKGKEVVKSRAYEDLKLIANLVEEELGCSSIIHILENEDAPKVWEEDGSYFYEVEYTTLSQLPF